MRTIRRSLLLAGALLALALASPPVSAQLVGTTPRPLTVSNLTKTTATSLDDFRGRLVLLEFFAHW